MNAEAIVRFELPAAYGPAIVDAVGLPVEFRAGVATIRAADPQPVLHLLTAWAEREHVTLAGLEVARTNGVAPRGRPRDDRG